ncbi:DUF4347 domain-containing protein [Kovacikia minuta CCNUW1]|uniref:DUF4347 domain-containing protein n=1 Tax=Kovacikia minuta TaxID=2931930 RepID=UPI001CCA2131|nr:DUF4347 domain-containing protein [Kovacikia minuta]UBF28094.1 DUF4347 domain-containing protein [Kovacikia minuta CCNUW1]
MSQPNAALGLDKPGLIDATIAKPGLGRSGQSLLFVDGLIDDYQAVVAGASAGTEVYLLNPVQDAVTQITNALMGRQGISSLQIVSHGEVGGLAFGSSRLNLADLPGYAAQIQSWQRSLTDDADILLYGCNVASGELGRAFVNILSQWTGADVAASDNLTGSAVFGGDWKLEYHTGQIETATIAPVNYTGTLAVASVDAGKLTIRKPYIGLETNALTFSLANGGADLQITDANNDLDAGSGVTAVNSNTVTVSLASLSEINLDLAALFETISNTFAGDSVTFSGDMVLPKLTIDLGRGNDLLKFEGLVKAQDVVITTGSSVSSDPDDDLITFAQDFTASSLKINAGSGDDQLKFDGKLVSSQDVAINMGSGNELVTFTKNVTTAGGNLSVQSTNIAVNDGVILSTRRISGTDPVNEDSVGNSGNMNFSGKTITIGKGASLLAHVQGNNSSYQAGSIKLAVTSIATSAQDLIEQAINNLGLGVVGVTDRSAIKLDGAILKGADVTLTAKAGSAYTSLSNSLTQKAVDFASAGIRAFADLVFGIPLAIQARKAEALIDVGNNSQIWSSRTVTIDASATTKSTAEASGGDSSLGSLPLSVTYGGASASAVVSVGENVVIDANNQVKITSNATPTAESKAGTKQNLGIEPTNKESKALAIAISYSELKSNVLVAKNTAIRGYSVAIKAIGTNKSVAGSTAASYDDGIGGLTVSVERSKSDVRAVVNGQISARDKNSPTEGGSLDIEATLTSTDTSTAQQGIFDNTILNKLLNADTSALASAARTSESFKNGVQTILTNIVGQNLGKSSAAKWLEPKVFPAPGSTTNETSQWSVTGTFAYSGNSHTVRAEIGSLAVLQSAVDINVTAFHKVITEVGAAASIEKQSGSDKAGAVSAGVSVADYDSNVQAIVGGGAKLDARRVTKVDAKVLYPFAYDLKGSVGASNEEKVRKFFSAYTKVPPFSASGFENAQFLANELGARLDDIQKTKPWTSWTKSDAEGDDIGVAGAVNILNYNNVVRALVGTGAEINQNPSFRNDDQWVQVLATSDMTLINLTGNPVKPVGSPGGGKGGAGGSVFVQNLGNTVRAEVEGGAKIYTGAARRFELEAKTDILNLGLTYAGARAGKFGVSAAVAVNLNTNNTVALLSNSAQITGGSVFIKALDNTRHWNFVGGVIKGQSLGLGASVAINDVNQTTRALIISGKGTPSTINAINISGDLNVEAENTGSINSLSLAGAIVASQPVDTNQSKSAPEDGGNFGVGVSGDVSINAITNDTTALIQGAKIAANSISVSAYNKRTINAISGSVAISTASGTSAGIAGSYSQNTLKGQTLATIEGSNLTTLNSFDLRAFSNDTIRALAAGGSGAVQSNGIGVAGSVTNNTIANRTLANISNSTGTIGFRTIVRAEDNSTIWSIAGSASFGGKVGVGASVALSTIRNPVAATLVNSTLSSKESNLFSAITKNDIKSVSASVGGSSEGLAAAVGGFHQHDRE